MNVNEFAEQIVFGKTLEDKLLVPGQLSDDESSRPKFGFTSLPSPGREIGLEMRIDKTANAQPPSDENLDDEKSRGKLLHFLANHELLATELMALVLLKFPDAPDSFRRGVLATLKEEQAHTRMYIQRMKECGVEFGCYPLSGAFWRIVEPMQSPIDFVTRLSLTFEQANLDYSLHFAKVFTQIGDDKTARILQQIYEDEIGHVHHGLHWFRQWKDPDQSDWQAYSESLQFPMSPQRGRGPNVEFNREGRERAGLTKDFIDSIEVFRQSRGRAATIRWFDPAAEDDLSTKDSDSRPEKVSLLMQQLGKDLELLMLVMAKPDDVILVRRMPSRAIRKHFIDVGFELPEFTLFEDRQRLCDRRLHDFSPWAWTPANHDIAEPLIDSTRYCPTDWHEDSIDLFRKTWAACKLEGWLQPRNAKVEGDTPVPDWFTQADCVGMQVSQLPEVDSALNKIAGRGFKSAIYKPDLSASGRGQRRLRCREPLSGDDVAWLKQSLSHQACAIVEPELDRVADISFLWRLSANSDVPQFLGWTQSLVTNGRRYSGTRLGNMFADCDESLKRFLLADRCARLQTTANWLEQRITPHLLQRNFSGYFGIDALVCRDNDDTLKIKPFVELNPRMTMGHIALKLQKRIAPGVPAEFRILSRQEANEVKDRLKEFGVPRSQNNSTHWNSGVVWFGEIEEATKLLPLLLIGNEAIAAATE